MVQRSAIAIAAISIVADTFLSVRYANYGSRSPQLITGNIYLLKVNQQVAYITYDEKLTLQALLWIAVAGALIFIVAWLRARRS